MRRAIALLSVAKKEYHHIRLSTDFRLDMMWWKVFASSWNGCSAYTLTGGNDFTVTSDASGSCAWHQTNWFQLSWDNRSQSMHISAKEMIPVLVSAAIWGKEWKDKRVLIRSDKTAVVSSINSRYHKDPLLMQLLRSLFP